MLSDGLSKEQVRVTVRLDQAMVAQLRAIHPGANRGLSWMLRKALTHYVSCAERAQADERLRAELGALLARRA
jgi:predicted transcriptional regulator